MKLKAALASLRINVEPYLIYWEEWKANENCNLSHEEIAIIDHYLASGFALSFRDKFMPQEKVDEIAAIAVKLDIAQRVFKEWVIVKFLFTVIEMAKDYGYDAFLNTPVSKLNIPEEVRTILKSFKVYSLQQLFILYRAEDFGRKWLYSHIIEFLKTVKKLQPSRI